MWKSKATTTTPKTFMTYLNPVIIQIVFHSLTSSLQFSVWLCLTLTVGVRRPSLAVAGLAHPDGAVTPASLWHRHPVAGARVAETLSTGSAVVLPLCLLKHFLAAMTGLGSAGTGRWYNHERAWHMIIILNTGHWVNNWFKQCQTSSCYALATLLSCLFILTVISVLGLQ